MTTYQSVYLNGVGSAGTTTFAANGIEFRDHSNKLTKTIESEQVLKSFVTSYGNKGSLQFVMKDGKSVQLDGFTKEDLEKVKQQIESKYSVSCEKSEVNNALPAPEIHHLVCIILLSTYTSTLTLTLTFAHSL